MKIRVSAFLFLLFFCLFDRRAYAWENAYTCLYVKFLSVYDRIFFYTGG